MIGRRRFGQFRGRERDGDTHTEVAWDADNGSQMCRTARLADLVLDHGNAHRLEGTPPTQARQILLEIVDSGSDFQHDSKFLDRLGLVLVPG